MKTSYTELGNAIAAIESYTPDNLGITPYKFGDPQRIPWPNVRLMLLSEEHRDMLVKACFLAAKSRLE
jgi:hypothetical protein